MDCCEPIEGASSNGFPSPTDWKNSIAVFTADSSSTLSYKGFEMTGLQLTSVLVCIASSVLTNANSTKTIELKWKKHYDSAKVEAQKSKRPLVVVIDKPDSKKEKIDETKLTNQDREKITKEKFELVRVDATTDYGKKVAAAFGATRFPYTAVTDDKSKRIVFRKQGQMSKNDWTLALAKSGKTKVVDQAGKKDVVAKPVVDSTRVHWQYDFASAKAMSQATNRPVFLYLTAPGCTYCEIMKADAMTKPWIIQDLNANFVPVQINGREQISIAQQFGVRMYPTLVAIAPTGEILDMWNGYRSLSDFESHLNIIKSRIPHQ